MNNPYASNQMMNYQSYASNQMMNNPNMNRPPGIHVGKGTGYGVAAGTVVLGIAQMGFYAYCVDLAPLYFFVVCLVCSIFTIIAGILLFFGIQKYVVTFVTFWTVITAMSMIGHLIMGIICFSMAYGADTVHRNTYNQYSYEFDEYTTRSPAEKARDYFLAVAIVQVIVFIIYIVFLMLISMFKNKNLGMFYAGQTSPMLPYNNYPPAGQYGGPPPAYPAPPGAPQYPLPPQHK